MKVLFSLFLSLIIISSLEASTQKKIRQQSNYLNSKGRLERRISRKLQDVAKEIISKINAIKILTRRIDSLDKSIVQNEAMVIAKKKILNSLLNNNKELSKRKKDLEKKIINIIAKDFSYFLISDRNYIETKDSILIEEIMDKMDIILRKEFSVIARNYEKINKNISSHEKKIDNIRVKIEQSVKNKKKLELFKKEKEVYIKKLNKGKLAYKKRLNHVEREKRSIRATLEKLKILKKAEDLRDLRASEIKKRKSKRSKLSVRQIGSSYQIGKVKRYRGPKTIAPLKSFTVKRKFGNYIDPVYNIKIFNESVVLESKIYNAKVKNILNGKVVFAKETAMLDKVIIIENAKGIHTIYAHLSQIAPTVKVGKKIRKGYVIGRVKNDLTFEVTQKSYHINPLQLIKLN
ncbi:MAG: peptidoglycan DD-metalloendopeptidase family protein [Epsilonproteobacteria bacterium]|nr:peptidoglycan DD-metalloendopeptidase family protein [Campylobacterota bacterium]